MYMLIKSGLLAGVASSMAQVGKGMEVVAQAAVTGLPAPRQDCAYCCAWPRLAIVQQRPAIDTWTCSVTCTSEYLSNNSCSYCFFTPLLQQNRAACLFVDLVSRKPQGCDSGSMIHTDCAEA